MRKMLAVGLFAALPGLFIGIAGAQPFPKDATFATFALTPLAIEGLTGDAAGNLYTTGRQAAGKNCPVWRIAPDRTRVTAGFIPNNPACNPSGIAFDALGNLYIADAARGGVIWRVTPDSLGCPSEDPATCSLTPHVSGVPGTNGLAFDRDGNLWTGDGTTGQGRVWKIKVSDKPANCATAPNDTCVEAFRIQPMANVLPAMPSNVANVGRDVRTLPPGAINAARTAAVQQTIPPCPQGGAPCVLGSQPLVANGVAFDHEGDLYIADTARGAIWRAHFHRSGDLKSRIGCDATFPANTLCLDNVYVAHPYLEGTDGIALDAAGNIWTSANERNAVVVVTKQREVVEIFRNPARIEDDSPTQPRKGLRNSADRAVGNDHILEFPTSPFLDGRRLCTSNSDGDRRDNSPRDAGEINAGAASDVPDAFRGKISCMDQELAIPGLPLPVR